MTWEITLGIFSLVAFVISVAAIAAKVSQAIAELKAAINMFNETLKDFKKDSKTDRKELHDRVDDHETRIGILEIKVDNRPNN